MPKNPVRIPVPLRLGQGFVAVTMTGNITLTDQSETLQRFNPDGAHTYTLPPSTSWHEGMMFALWHVGSSNNVILANAAASTLVTLSPGDLGVAFCASDGTWTAVRIDAGGLTTAADIIAEITSGAGVTVDGVLLKDAQVSTNTINELTAAAGVTIDGVLLKDSEVKTDTVIEKTSAAGVTLDGLQIKDASVRPTVHADPGDAGAIPVTSTGTCAVTTAGAETRTLAIPTFAGQRLTIVCTVYVGDAVITSAQAINVAGNTLITLEAAGNAIELVAVSVAGALRWRVVFNDGCTLA